MHAQAAKFDDGWLAKAFHDCEISMMVNHDPSFVIEQLRLPVTLPISEADATELFNCLSARFRAWTGKPLKR